MGGFFQVLDFRLLAVCVSHNQLDGLKTFPRKVLLTPFRIPNSFLKQKAITADAVMTFSGGELGIRTLGEFPHTAFRVLHLRPLGQLSVYGATSRTRTDDLRITNALLYQLSHSSVYPTIIMDIQKIFKCFFYFIFEKGASICLLLLFFYLLLISLVSSTGSTILPSL